MSDPFDEAPHDHSAPPSRPLLGRFSRSGTSLDDSSPHGSPAAAASPAHADPCTPTTPAKSGSTPLSPKPALLADEKEHDPFGAHAAAAPPTVANPRLAAGVQTLHGRKVSGEEMTDHMDGSVYAPHEICPACGSARSTSVHCPVSQRHHGTDEEVAAPGAAKGFFGFFRNSRNNVDGDGDGSDDDAARRESALSEPGVALGTDHLAVTPGKERRGFFSFRTKEEKAFDDACSQLKSNQRTGRKIIETEEEKQLSSLKSNYATFLKQVKDIAKQHVKEREQLVAETATANSTLKEEWKKETEDLSKLMKKSREDAKKAQKDRERLEKEDKKEPLEA